MPITMRPLAELPRAELARLRGLLTDIDDTLVDHGAITADALAALQSLAAANIPVIAITGRPAGWSEPFARAWPVRAIVAENGGVLLRHDEAGALVREFTAGAAERKARSARLRACADDIAARIPQATLARDSPGRLTDIAIDHSEFARLDAATIERVAEVMREHGLTATVSSIHINGWIGEHSKWTAAQWAVRRCLGMAFDAAEWLYLGDSTNDALMFARMPLSVAVANVRRCLPQLTALPGYVTAAERGAGFAELAAAWLAARASRTA